MALYFTRSDVANEALSMVSDQHIASLEDGSPAARLCAFHVDRVKTDLLRDYPWNWAERRARLARRVGTPLFGWDHAFSLPHDFVRVNAVYPDDTSPAHATIPYSIEVVEDEADFQLDPQGRHALLADAEQVYLAYVADIVNPNAVDPWFRRAWAAELATRIAYRLTGRMEIAEVARREADRFLRIARARDAAEEPAEQVPESSLILAREAGV